MSILFLEEKNILISSGNDGTKFLDVNKIIILILIVLNILKIHGVDGIVYYRDFMIIKLL